MKSLLSTSLLAVTICLIGLAYNSEAYAASQDETKLKIYVVPLKCVLEKINDGINDISSLKPADCKKKIQSISPPPFIEPDGGIIASPLSDYPGAFSEAGLQEKAPSELVIEDPDIKLGTEATVPKIFAKGTTLVLQVTTSIFIIFLIGYIFIRRLFGFL